MSEQITVTLPDGSAREVDAGTTPAAWRPASDPGWRKPRSPPRPTASGSTSIARSITTSRSRSSRPTLPDGREVLRHSTAHVLAEAVTRLFPGAKYAIGPAIEDGFYYDFELPDGKTFSEDDLEKIEPRCARS
jgi:threonyl-tRNA synthetase